MTVLLREILHIQPWSKRYGSVEQGQLVYEIAVVLNSLEDMNFKVTTRSVRVRYTLPVKKYKTKWSDEEKVSGINPKHTEIDDTLLDLIQRFDEADSERKKESEEKNAKKEEDLFKAQEIRKKSLKTFGETTKRKTESEKKTSKSTSNFLAEKSEREHKLRKEEVKLRKQEIENQTQQIQNSQFAQQVQLSMLQQQDSLMMEMLQKFC